MTIHTQHCNALVPPVTAAALNNRFGTQIDSSCVCSEQHDSFGGGKKQSILIFINQIGLRMKFKCARARVSLFDRFISLVARARENTPGKAMTPTPRETLLCCRKPLARVKIIWRCRLCVCYTFSNDSHRFQHTPTQPRHYFSNYSFRCVGSFAMSHKFSID